MKFKSVIAIVCCIAIIFSILTVGVSAETSSSDLALKEGDYEKWIDRISDLPDYSADLYEWLVTNSKQNGALVDPSKGGQKTDTGYVYLVEQLSESLTLDADMEKGLNNIAEETVGQLVTEFYTQRKNNIFAVLSAFDHDHPEVFFLNSAFRTTCSWGYTYSYSGGSTFTVDYFVDVYLVLQDGEYDIRADEYTNYIDIIMQMYELQALVEAIVGDIPAGASRYEQVRYLNGYLTGVNCYNSSSDLNSIDNSCRECISGLAGRTDTEGPVCEGYARAFKVLCDKIGIPCVIITGTAKNSVSSEGEAHMWNAVQMEDGNWYAVDVTWNDPTVQGVTSAVSGYEDEDYLLVGSDTVINDMTFSASHTKANDVMGSGLELINDPELSDTAYDPSSAPVAEVVATIDGVNYYSFTAAVAAVKNGGEIVLLKNPESGEIPVVNTPKSFIVTYEGNVGVGPDDIAPGADVKRKVTGNDGITAYVFYDCDVTVDVNGGEAIADRYLTDGAISGDTYRTPSKFWYTAPKGMMFSCWEINGEYYPHNTNIVLYEDTTVKAIWAPLVELTDDKETLMDAVLTEDDKALGVNVAISLNVTDISETISLAEKQAIAKQLGEHAADMYLDIDLVKTVMGQTSDVTQTNAPIKVTITVPADLVMPNATYRIARLHNGAVDILEGEFDPEYNTFTFETDKFSTYALIVTEETDAPLGDVNGDGEVNSSDAVAILRYLAGYDTTGYDLDSGDYNGDGMTNSSDAVAILRMLAGYND